jgi:ribonuclease P protein component
MINRAHRFHGINALRHVYAHGRTVRSPLMAIRFMPNDRRTSYRAAVVVSRKTNKSAVVRNRIRRRIYEILRRHEPQISRPYDIVVTVFSDEVATIDAEALEAEIHAQLEKAGIIVSGPAVKSHAIVIPKEK